MKIKKTLVTLLLVIVLALSMTLFVACGDKNDNNSNENETLTVDSDEFNSLVDKIIGYVLSSAHNSTEIDIHLFSPCYDRYADIDALIGMQGMIIVSHPSDKKTCYLYIYDSTENATNAYELVQEALEQGDYDPDYAVCIKGSNIVAQGNACELYEEIKASTVPTNVLTEKQLTFIRNSISSQLSKLSELSDKSWNTLSISLYTDKSERGFYSYIIYNNSEISNVGFEFTTELDETAISDYNRIKNEIGTTYTTNSYVHIEEDGIYAYFEQIADEE